MSTCKISLCIILFLSLIRLTVSSTPPLITIQSPDGDLIDCINITEQEAFTNPLLKHHQLQRFPTGFDKPDGEREPAVRQVWHGAKVKCPTATIPVRRELGHVPYHKAPPKFYEVPVNATQNHKYAVAFQEDVYTIHGTRATLNVWAPRVESADDFSLAQMWLATGSYGNGNLNTIEAGWLVFRDRYHDDQPRLFTFWTRDAYRTRCSTWPCPGFVHTSTTIAQDAAIEQTSVYEGQQLDITLQVWKDSVTGNWWLGLGLNTTDPIGYWPGVLFTDLADYATMVHWGGEVYYKNSSGMNKTVEMGSGEFADEGFKKSAYFCNLQVEDQNNTLRPVKEIQVFADYPEYYTVKKLHNRECGAHFFYGGPGPRPLSSIAVCGSFELFLALMCFVIIIFV